jgi:holo-[acyl-carrier protein] synthase
MHAEDGIVAAAFELVAISEVAPLLARGEAAVFTPAERAYAASKSDPERRLAARLAAKRAALRLLGGDARIEEVEILRSPGRPPRIELSGAARQRLQALGADRVLTSLTHGRTHAAASVLLVRSGE